MWMLKRSPIDHDLIIDKHMNIYVVFGSIHPPGRVYAYLKYISHPIKQDKNFLTSIWRYATKDLYRVLRRYSAEEVSEALDRYSVKKFHDIVYGVEMPYLSYEDIYVHLTPEERLREIYYNPRDELELITAETVDHIRSYVSISLKDIGVGGSLLGGFHNTTYSDIDLVVYGATNACSIYETSNLFLESLKDQELEVWIKNQISLHNIDFNTAREMYHIYRRGVFKKKYVTFTFPSDPRNYPSRYMSRPIRCVRAKIQIEERQCKALQYPGEVYIDKILETDVSDRYVRSQLKKLFIYEGSFSPLLFKGGIFKITGSIQKAYDFETNEEYYVLVLGSRECKTEIFRV